MSSSWGSLRHGSGASQWNVWYTLIKLIESLVRCEANNANNDGQQLEGNEAFNLTNKSKSNWQTYRQTDGETENQSVI